MASYILKICVDSAYPDADNLKKYYQDKVQNLGYDGDSGIDLMIPQDVTIATNTVEYVDLHISCELISVKNQNQSLPYMLVPRSSISATPLYLANSIGIIDAGYRGNLKAALACRSDRRINSTIFDNNYTITAGTRLLQIVAPELKPIRPEVVVALSSTARGTHGFGSTGTH